MIGGPCSGGGHGIEWADGQRGFFFLAVELASGSVAGFIFLAGQSVSGSVAVCAYCEVAGGVHDECSEYPLCCGVGGAAGE